MKHVRLFVFLIGMFSVCALTHAQSTDDLQSQINSKNKQIADLEADIAQYQKQLDTLAKQKGTLQSAISSLGVSQKQLAAQIQVTETKIGAANLELERLGDQISTKEGNITESRAAIGKALQDMAEGEQRNLVEQLLGSGTIAESWNRSEEVIQFNRALDKEITDLETAKQQLSQTKDAVSDTKTKLVSLQNDLTVQKRSVDANKNAQQALLAQTKNQESTYQKLLAQKKAAENVFEQELNNLQSQLNLIVHPGSLPKVGTGVLSWPLSVSFMQNCQARSSVFGNAYCITQFFGTTPFSTANPQVYNGGGHNAIDIGTPIGTPIKAALGGVVLGTGNTDLVRGCYSFGKWVMVKHANGLSTLYAHLSEIDSSPGQTVNTGDLLGLSGMTGYATGPHLHFGVYATEGTKITTLGAFRGGGGTPCANATMPVATKDAYLNPLSYL